MRIPIELLIEEERKRKEELSRGRTQLQLELPVPEYQYPTETESEDPARGYTVISNGVEDEEESSRGVIIIEI